MVVLQFESEEWSGLLVSRHGAKEFTIVRHHGMLEECSLPTVCLVLGRDNFRSQAPFGVIRSRASVATLQSRIKIRRAERIQPDSKDHLLRIVSRQRFKGMLRAQMRSDRSLIALSPTLSSYLIELLSSIAATRTPMQAVSSLLSCPNTFRRRASLQEDVMQTEFRAFGLVRHNRSVDLQFFNGRETALEILDIVEDSVIANDARSVPDFGLIQSHVEVVQYLREALRGLRSILPIVAALRVCSALTLSICTRHERI